MKGVMGLVDLQRQESRLQDFTGSRPLSSMPIGGRYRIIDFALSSLVNSGIKNVGVLLPEKSRSILDHLRSGKDWDLARHHKGLFYLPPVRSESVQQEGDLRNIYYNLDFVENSSEKYILLSRVTSVYTMDFRPALDFHEQTGADITMIVNAAEHEEPCDSLLVDVAENGLVKDISLRHVVHEGELRSLGVFLMDKALFVRLVRRAFEHGGTDFRFDVFLREAARRTIYAYEHKGYVCHISSMLSYYEANMKMLEPAIQQDLFFREDAPVYTKVKDMAPVRYDEGAVVSNSLVANGCIVHGHVENSVLFRGVRVEAGATVKNCVLMQDTQIESGAQLDCIICDKNVVITADKKLRGVPTYPIYVEKNKRV